MINFINNISNFVIKSLFEAHRIFLIGTILCVGFFSTDDISKISMSLLFLYTFLVLITSYVLTEITFKKGNGETSYRKTSTMLGLIISLALVFFMKDTNITFKAYYFFYFMILWINGIKIYLDSDTSSSYTQKFITSLVAILLTVVTIAITHWNCIFGNLGRYFLPYLFIWLVLMSRMNLNEAYSSNEKNTIDKSKNTFKFNLFTLILITIISLPSFIFKFNPTNLLNFALSGFNYLLKGFSHVFALLYKFLGKFANGEERVSEFQSNVAENLGNETQESLDFLNNPYKAATITVEVIKWIAIIAFTIFLTVYIYKLLKDIFKSKDANIKSDEIKDFILTKEDMINNLKNPFNNLYKNISKILKKEQNDKKLPIIRKLYCDSLEFLISKGYKFKKHFTPNEFLESIDEDNYKNNNFDKLTSYYNEARYGNKSTSNDKEKDAIKIVNELKGMK